MKNSGTLFLLCAIGLSLVGCSASAPKDAFPEMIGTYKLNGVSQVGGMFEAKSWYPATYSTVAGQDDKQIFYGLAVHKNAEAARQDQATNIFCSKTKIAADKKSDLGVVKDSKLEIIKEDKLRDKSGTELGNITLCRNEVAGTFQSDLLGNYEYTIVFNHDNRMVVLKGDIKTIDDKQVPLGELLDFMKALPGSAQVDFASLKLDALPGANVTHIASATELAALAPPVQLARTPYLKGQVLIVESEEGSKLHLFATSPDRYGLSKARMAQSGADAQTVIQVVCEQGEKIGTYVTKDAEQRRIPAYAAQCQVSIIDQTIPAVIAQKTFVNGEIPLFEEEKTFKETDREYVVPRPFTAMASFLKSLPAK